MRILLTNNSLAARAGSELYVRDIAIELMRRGHQPVAYSTNLGVVAEELRAATVPVIDRLSALGEPPDIIHGQHHYETLTALLRFPDTPAIYYCHGWLPWQEATLRHPNIVRYIAVDHLCRERLIVEGGVSPDQIEVVLNFFDQRLFPPRPPLPAVPRRALVFSNEFTSHSGLPALMEACARCGIELHIRGLGIGNPTDQPGALLASYDIVFAKARAAIEAMAVGASVVLCASGKLGPMVTTESFSSLRPWNFGIRTLAMHLDADLVTAELQKYNCEDASRVSHLVRTSCELQSAADQIVDIYQKVLADDLPARCADRSHAGVHAAEYLEHWASRYKSASEVMSERDHWVGRCNVAEQALAQRDQQLRERQSAVEDRQRWIDRCLAAEQALAQQLHEQQSVVEDRQRWIDRCLAAEQAQAELAAERAGWEARSSAAKEALLRSQRLLWAEAQQTAHAQNLLGERDAEVNFLAQKLRAVHASATWRWSQGILKSPPVRLLFGGLIRSVAERSRTTGFAPVPAMKGKPADERASKPTAIPEQESPDLAVCNLQARADRMISERGFLGVPRETFAQAGREQLIALLAEGLRPESKVLEFGCGCLRIACWLIRFLDSGGYYGIEPARQRIDYGLHYLFTPEELQIKRPRFDYNPVFNSSVFDTKFDFFLARSIWTHASKLQIEATLDSFLRTAAPRATFLASYLPAQSPDEDYQGTQWVGTSHESDTPGVIRHALSWIVEQCRSRGLNCEEIAGVDCDSQLWLRIRHTLP